MTERVLAAVVKALNDNNIFLEGCLLKPNMVTPGSKNPDRHKISPTEIGIRTATALSRTIPPSMVGVFVNNLFSFNSKNVYLFFF